MIWWGRSNGGEKIVKKIYYPAIKIKFSYINNF
jgi:hypothetical protein